MGLHRTVNRQVVRWSESATLAVVSRLAVLLVLFVGVPFGAWFATESYRRMVRIEEISRQNLSRIEDNLMPRISSLEGDVVRIDGNLWVWTSDRFTASQAAEQRRELRAEIAEVRADVIALTRGGRQ